MEHFILTKDHLTDFLKALGKYDLFAPITKGDTTTFEPVSNPEGVVLDLEHQPHPPKKVIYPQTEVLFTFDKKGVAREPLPSKQKERIVFGVRPCDARGFSIIDPVFEKDFPDPYYLEKRAVTILIGLQCAQPYANCFCTSLGGDPSSTEGLDILFYDLGDRYLLEVLTARGEQVVQAAAPVLDAPGGEAEQEKKETVAKATEKVPRGIALQGIAEKIAAHFDHPVWRELAQKCLSCGICTYTCPTCYCFDVQDETLKGRGKRVRIWDSCMFSEYTLHASGHNPRPTRAERLRNRIYHKFKQNPEAHGVEGCVGCGRCITFCPVNEDILENLQTIQSL
jgi:sulfhydrogenase subunit beta (sulfur reductase)